MKFLRLAPIAGAAALLFIFACDNSSDSLSPNDKPSLAAGGNDNNQRAEGHVVNDGGTEQYTFNALGKKGEFSGHFSLTLQTNVQTFTVEADVTCLAVVPGTRHAIMRGVVTSANLEGVLEGQIVGWNVTDGGNGSKGLSDTGSDIYLVGPTTEDCVADLPEQPSDQTNVKVKP